MAVKKRLLFLYMVPATGHQSAAEAIIKAAAQMNPQIECIGLDAGNQTYPLLGNVVNRMYLQLIKRAPVIWDYLYDNPDVEEVTREMRQVLTLFSTFRVRKILRQNHPQAVICTQAMPAIAMASLRRQGVLKVPLVGVITDFGVHAYWYQPEIDLYLVGHEDIREEMARRGVSPQKIRVTGIPIDPRFGESIDAAPLRSRFNLSPNKKTILVMGGSHGLGSLDAVVEALKMIPMSFQTLVVCGRNKKLQRRIIQSVRGVEGFRVLGYTRDISTVMDVSDILVTKPGGLSTSEALAKELPMVLTDPIPGQEQRNVRFLTDHGVARLANSREELIHLVSDLLRHPKKITAMRQRARMIGKPYSAWEAARSIFSLVNQQGRV